MLVAQAKESAEWFTGKKIKDEMIGKVYSLLRRQMENIVLIGMPGSGKSTIGKLLAERLHRTFVDSDACIVEAAGRPIPEIFAEDGEEGFRALEAKVLANLGKQSGLVIATGGGCVTRSENYASLHQNGTILWLKRNLEELPTSGRPLSQAGSLQKMYEARKPLYEAFSDLTVASCRVVQDTVNSALCALCMEDMVGKF